MVNSHQSFPGSGLDMVAMTAYDKQYQTRLILGGYPMANDMWSPKPYSDPELLSFDRLKRAVQNRVSERAEAMMDEEFPLSEPRVFEITNEEWKRAKEAVKNSPNAREAYRKYLESMISDHVDGLIKEDKADLGKMGVVEKSI
jgi:hypothetical protein